MSDSEKAQCLVSPPSPPCVPASLRAYGVCACPLLLCSVCAGSHKVLRALLSPVKHVCCLCLRDFGSRQQEHKDLTLTNITPPPGKFSPEENPVSSNLTSWSRRGRLALVLVPHILKPHFKNIRGFSFNAATVFVVVSYCSGEAEGWRPQASNKIFNELVLQGKV